MFGSAFLCALIAAAPGFNPVAGDTCNRVAFLAESHQAPAELALAIGLVESRFNPAAVSRARARGALQVLPRYHCPAADGGRARRGNPGLAVCDYERAGVVSLARLVNIYGPKEAAARYNAGNSPRRGAHYARRVLAIATLLRLFFA